MVNDGTLEFEYIYSTMTPNRYISGQSKNNNSSRRKYQLHMNHVEHFDEQDLQAEASSYQTEMKVNSKLKFSNVPAQSKEKPSIIKVEPSRPKLVDADDVPSKGNANRDPVYFGCW